MTAMSRRVSLHGLLVVKVAVTGGGHDDVMAPPGCPHPPYDPLHPKQWPREVHYW